MVKRPSVFMKGRGAMKICPKCGENNPDSAKLCAACFASLAESVKPAFDSEEFFLREEKRDRRKRRIHLLLIPLYYVVYLLFFILCCIENGGVVGLLLIPLLFPALFYLFVFHPDALFAFQHMFDIDNLHDVQISDWYYFTSRLSGYFFLILGLFLVISNYIGLCTEPSGITVYMESALSFVCFYI